MVVPDDLEVKSLLVSELHSVPYAAHPGVQRTIDKVRRYFWWKGMAGDIREFVEACPICQLEKTDHTMKKGSLQSLVIPCNAPSLCSFPRQVGADGRPHPGPFWG